MKLGNLLAPSTFSRKRFYYVHGLPGLSACHSAHSLNNTRYLVVVGRGALGVQSPHEIFKRYTKTADEFPQRLK
jgi:hypothetical protein